MGGDPMTVSSEYLDLVKLTADFDIEIGDDASTDSTESDGVGISTVISYLLTPLDFVIHLVDAWIEDRVKKIIKKTAHLRKRYY